MKRILLGLVAAVWAFTLLANEENELEPITVTGDATAAESAEEGATEGDAVALEGEEEVECSNQQHQPLQHSSSRVLDSRQDLARP